MSRLTVTEKEHWKSRIEQRINRAIEKLQYKNPIYMSTIQAEARASAFKKLGIADLHLKRESLLASIKELQSEADAFEQSMFNQVLGPNRPYPYHNRSDLDNVVRKEAAHIEDELLAGDELGRQILKFRAEKESLLDTVWLATSSQQVRELWHQVAAVLGDEPTALQAVILAKTVAA